MTDKAVEHYDREAERYDRRWRFSIRATVDAVVSSLHLPEDGLLLDVACATGALPCQQKIADSALTPYRGTGG